jgi:nitrite reductase (NADH) large subunit
MKIVIVGAGPAGVSVVETVRAADRKTQIVMFTNEPYAPYSPPAMADHFITGSDVHLWRGVDWPERMGVEYRSGAQVVSLDLEDHHITLTDGAVESYDQLVIATGSRLYAPLDGVDLPGVYNFKSLSAAEELVDSVRRGKAKTALIVGAGFIGMEIALLLRELGVEVTQVEMLDQMMPRMLDAETSAIALDLMHERGIDVRLNTKAIAFEGNGQAVGVRLESGDVLSADLYVAATGVKPNVALLEGSGIAHGWGIQVDEYLRTSVPDVYAAGDVIESPYRLTGEVFVHAIFPNAVAQGQIVGFNLLGYDVAYEGADRMNSLKHLGLPIMAVGQKDGDEVLQSVVGSTRRTLYLQDNRLVGFQLVGDISPAGVFRTLMNQRRDVRPFKDRLLEPTFGQGVMTWLALEPG